MQRFRTIVGVVGAFLTLAVAPAVAQADYPTTDEAFSIAQSRTLAPSNGAYGLPALVARNGVHCSADVFYLNSTAVSGPPYAGSRAVWVTWWDKSLEAKMQWKVVVTGTSAWPTFYSMNVVAGPEWYL
jgi:hypothetical protein